MEGLPLDGSLKMDSESGFTYRKPVLLERPDVSFFFPFLVSVVIYIS